MSNTVVALWASIVRTFTPIIVGFVVGWFVTLGIPLDDQFSGLLQLVVGGILTAVYYVLVRLLETYVTPKFGWLLGLAKTPTSYTPESPASVGSVTDAAGVTHVGVLPANVAPAHGEGTVGE